MGNQPTGPQPQPVIADLPRADSVIELSRYEVGGGGVPVGLGLGIMDSQLPQPDDTDYPPSILASSHIPQGEPGVIAIPTDVAQPSPPPAEDPAIEQEIALAVHTPPPPPSPPRVIEFFRTGEEAFVTANRSVHTTANGPTAILHSIEEVLKRHRAELANSDTANTSVKEALRTRGDAASKMIIHELKQILDKKVWVPVSGGAVLTASQRSAIIRSSMFLKRKNHSDESFHMLKARLVAGGGTSKIRDCMTTYPHRRCQPARCSLC